MTRLPAKIGRCVRAAIVPITAVVVPVIGSVSDVYARSDLYAANPVWYSGKKYTSRAVAVGDIDLDGDLDVVFGNDGVPNTLYLNDDGVLNFSPAWESGDSAATFAVALGDINDDGYPDLVCGNADRANQLFLNEKNGRFAETPAWTSESDASQTESVILGDVDGDGDLDVVFGNHMQATTLYLNVGEVFDAVPAWDSGVPRRTAAVALGDISGNRKLDLVIGNDIAANMLFYNNDGIFGDPAVWDPPIDTRTIGVALGDVNGDGHLDLVCGNANESNLLYMNDGGAIADAAIWKSHPARVTTSVAFGDIDGDGDLDLICGNNLQKNTVYLNEEGAFGVDPAWESNLQNGTFAVVPADVDGDGDLDMICANGDGPDRSNTLYRNDTALLDATPVWMSEPTNSSFGVALGDVDGDGDLDAVFGNGRFFGQSNTLYDNQYRAESGEVTDSLVFSVNPVWWSEPPENSKTIGIALGDVDEDQRIDLVAANALSRNTLYMNTGTVFGDSAAPWSPTPTPSGTITVALGDVDGDGDLDLVCGNGGTENLPNTMYRNIGGVFADTIAWMSGGEPVDTEQHRKTIGVALGDVDGDGDLDLVCGNNDGQVNTLYLNDGFVFGNTPVWTSGYLRDTFGVALGDVDGDGDLDLVCGNAGTAEQGNTAYLNDGGIFEEFPIWESGRTDRSTFGIALGDLDGDGSLDLVCGNGGTDAEMNTAYLNTRAERIFPATPAWESEGADWTFGVAVGDVDDDGDVDVVFANTGITGQSNMLYLNHRGPVFKGDPVAPTSHLPNNSPYLVRVRVQSDDPSEPNLRTVSFIAIDVESDPIRIVPEYQYEGDWEWFSVEVPGALEAFDTSPQGEGNQFDWDMSRIPFDRRPVVLRLRVVEIARHVGSTHHIASYVKRIGAIEPIRPEITTIPSHIDFATACVCETTRTSVEVRNTGTAPLELIEIDVEVLDPNPLPSEEIWVDVALPLFLDPGSAHEIPVFLRPTRDQDLSGVLIIRSNDWITDADTVEFDAHIIGIASEAIPHKGTDIILARREIKVSVELPEGGTFVEGYIEFREGGRTGFDPLQRDALVQSEGPLLYATVPDSIVGTRGVEYRVRAKVAIDSVTFVLNDPPCDPFERWVSVGVSVEGTPFPYVLPTLEYRMFSIPFDMDGTILGTLNELGAKNTRYWKLWGYYDDAAPPGAVPYQRLPNDSTPVFEQGRGYWLIVRNEGIRLNTGPTVGVSAPTGSAFAIALEPGWNMIGSPFDFDIAWDSVRVDTATFLDAVEAGVVEPPRRWIPGNGYDPNDVVLLEPFEGYWIKNITDPPGDVVLHIQPVENITEMLAQRMAAGRLSFDGEGPDEWRMTLTASSGGVRDDHNVLGFCADARLERDRYDRSDPPLHPGVGLSLYFPHTNWDKRPGWYTVDIRGMGDTVDPTNSPSIDESEWGGAWAFDVAKTYSERLGTNEVVIEFRGVGEIPVDAGVMLIDRTLGRMIDVRTNDTYVFYQGKRGYVSDESEARFVLLVGSAAFVDSYENGMPGPPRSTVLRQNFPNPFNPSTVIRYEVARRGRVSVRVYDVTGALVTVLENRVRDPGRYEVGWNGTNGDGRPVSSGVYFCRLQVGGIGDTKKMILIK